MAETALPLRVLIVEDNTSDAELMLRELRRAGFEVEWHRVHTERDFLARLEEQPDIVLSDYELPQFNGVQALGLLRATSRRTSLSSWCRDDRRGNGASAAQ